MSVSAIVFLCLYFGGIVASIIRHPIFGFLSYLLAFYCFPEKYWWGASFPNLRWSLLAASFTLIGVFIHKNKLSIKAVWYSNGAAKILILYTAWMWVQLIWALDFDQQLNGAVLFTKYIVLFYLVYMLLDSEKQFFLFLFVNTLGSFYFGREILAYSLTGRIEGLGGPGVDDSNTLGLHLSVGLIFASMALIKPNTNFYNPRFWKALKILILISIPFIANGIVQTISRSAIVGLVAAGLVMWIIKPKKLWKAYYIYGALALIGLITFTPYTFWDRMFTLREATIEGQLDGAMETRVVLAKAQIKMFMDYPLGSGHEGTDILSRKYLDDRYLTYDPRGGHFRIRSSHNTFLTTLVEQGFPGAILSFCLIIWVIITINSFKKDDVDVNIYLMASACSLVAIFVAGIFVDYLKIEIQIWCLGMLASLREYASSKDLLKS